MGLYQYREFIASEKACNRFIRDLRWPKGGRCPGCGYSRIWRIQEKERSEYICKRCRYHFSLTTGTVFEKTRTPLSKWILAVGLFKTGVSAHRLKEEVNVTYKTAWKMLNMIRSCISHGQLIDKLKGRVEVEDTYFGGRQKGKRGRGAAHKRPAVGMDHLQSYLSEGDFKFNERNNGDFIATVLLTLITSYPLMG